MTEDEDFLKNAKEIVDNFQRSIGWDPDENNFDEFVQCPVNKSHTVPLESLQKHTESCKWRSYGYSKQEVKEILESESQPKTSSYIDLDKIISEIHPGLPPIRTHERYVIELSRDERLRVYDVMMESVQSHKREIDPNLLVDFSDKIKGESNQKAIDELELLKMQRDHKRRRQTYRAKNVHITKRSQTEIIREVLRIHMDEYRESLIGDQQHHEDHERNTKSSNDKVTQSSNITKSHEGPRNDCTSKSRHEPSENYHQGVSSSEVRSHERRRDRDRNISYERRDDKQYRSFREEQHRNDSQYDHRHSREKRHDHGDTRTSRDNRNRNCNENEKQFRDEKLSSREIDTKSHHEKGNRDREKRLSSRDKRSHDYDEPFERDESGSRKKKSRHRERSYERHDHDRDRFRDEDREMKRKSKKEEKKHSKKKKDSKKD